MSLKTKPEDKMLGTQKETSNYSLEPVQIQGPSLLETQSTDADADGMRRMGKTQQLVRNFRFTSITSFTALATAAWEIGLFVINQGLIDGGRAGLVYSYLWSIVGFGPVYLSLAEMASMAPIAGGQYHWVSEFAPEKYQRFLSYLTGWTSTIAWQAGNAEGIFLVGSLAQTLILINNSNYGFPNYQGSLLAIASMAVAYIGNVYGGRAIPYWTRAVFVVHIIGYFLFLIPVWVNAPRASNQQVWAEFSYGGGWNSRVLTVLVGQLSGILLGTGADTAAHMAEEVKDASYTIPRTMMGIYFLNFALTLPMILTVVYHLPNLTAGLSDPTTYPAIYVLRQSMNTTCLTLFLVLTILLNVTSNIVYLAAVSRDLFAFARDRGFPFSNWISKVHNERRIPVNACIFSCTIAVLLSLIYIGSTTAFYAITSLFTVAILQCYGLSIGCVLWRRIYEPHTLPPSQFSLGRLGIPLNVLAVLYCTWAFFWSFWPQFNSGSPVTFNWASVIFVGTLAVAIIYFLFRAKNTYFGPVTAVEGRKRSI